MGNIPRNPVTNFFASIKHPHSPDYVHKRIINKRNKNTNKFVDDEELMKMLNDFVTENSNEFEETGLIPIMFQWPYGGKAVFVCGSFHNWKEKIQLKQISKDYINHGNATVSRYVSKMKSKPNIFYGIVYLPVGTYTYRFIVDGKWTHDKEKSTIYNSLGTPENFLEIKLSDFHIDDALLSDEIGSKNKTDNPSTSSPKDLDSIYNQEVPDYNIILESLSLPPALPSHFESKVVFHMSTDSISSRSFSSSADHVLLRHILTCVLENKTIVISMISTYRKKRITTIFYKAFS